MKEFIEANGGIIATVMIVMVSLNLFLSGLSMALAKFKDLTKTDVDNKVYAVVGSILGFLSKALDMIGYNPEHKK